MLKHVLTAALLVVGSAGAQAQTPPAIFQSWLTSLQAQGYKITQGTAYEFTPTYCTQVIQPVFGTCFSSDPGDPYLVTEPPIGNGYLDPYYGKPTAVKAPMGGAFSDQFFRLDPTEAELVIVNLPPQAAYFSYETYMFSRPIVDYLHGFSKLSPDPKRAQIFGSFNNSIDNVTIQRQSGLNFGQGTVAFITTPNSTLATSLTTSFTGVGGNANLLFTEAMPNTLHPGWPSSSDDFISAMRYSLPQDQVAGDAWRAAAPSNIIVYRVVQPATQAVARFGAATIANKQSRTYELNQTQNLTELSTLLENWLTTQEPGHTVMANPTVHSEVVNANGKPISGELGPYCISNGTNCAADSQDTDDYKTFVIGPFGASQIVIMDGVDHTYTNNSTDVTLSVTDLTTGTGIASASQTNPTAAGFSAGSLSGSALTVLQDLGLYSQASPTLQANLPYLYVHLFARPCVVIQTYCTAPYTSIISTTDLNTTDNVMMFERAYVLPGYPNGANPNNLLNPAVIH